MLERECSSSITANVLVLESFLCCLISFGVNYFLNRNSISIYKFVCFCNGESITLLTLVVFCLLKKKQDLRNNVVLYLHLNKLIEITAFFNIT